MATNDKPAILSAEEVGRLALLIRGSIHGGAIAAGEDALAALLGHIDALTRGATNEGDLGLAVFAASDMQAGETPEDTASEWERLLPDARAEMVRQGSALFTLGRAVGRSEGDAERARLAGLVDTLASNARAAVEMVGRLADKLAERDAEIASLTAELSKTLVSLARFASDLVGAEQALDAARAEGARVEREACAKSLLALSRDPLTSRQMDLIAGILAAVEHIRARGEGRQG